MIRGLPTHDPEELLRQQRYPTWFFTNEQIAHVWETLPEFPDAPIVGVAGAGDWALNYAASGRQGVFHLVDNRAFALVTLELKLALLQQYDKDAFRLLFQEPNVKTADVLANVAPMLSEPTQAVFTKLVQRHEYWNNLLRERSQWYRESWHALRQSDYLGYLSSDDAYARARAAGSAIALEHGPIHNALSMTEDGSLGLIYLSNLLDSTRYVANSAELIAEAHRALVQGGLLVCLTQHAPQKLQRPAEHMGFRLVFLEQHRFNLLQSLRGFYQYSILMFRSYPRTDPARVRYP